MIPCECHQSNYTTRENVHSVTGLSPGFILSLLPQKMKENRKHSGGIRVYIYMHVLHGNTCVITHIGLNHPVTHTQYYCFSAA